MNKLKYFTYDDKRKEGLMASLVTDYHEMKSSDTFSSQFGGLEGVMTALADQFGFFRKRRTLTVAVVCGYCFLLSLPTVTYVSQLLTACVIDSKLGNKKFQ